MKHTPTPPFTVTNYTEHHSEIYDANNHPICVIRNANLAKVKAYREHIVHCVNLHDELVEALQAIAFQSHDEKAVQTAKEALTKAEEV